VSWRNGRVRRAVGKVGAGGLAAGCGRAERSSGGDQRTRRWCRCGGGGRPQTLRQDGASGSPRP